MGTRSDYAECCIKHVDGEPPSFAISMEKEHNLEGKQPKKEKKKVKTVRDTHQAVVKPWLDGVKAAGILNHLYLLDHILLRLLSHGKKRWETLITPVMIKKKSSLTFRAQAEHAELAVKIGTWCSLNILKFLQ